MWCEYCSKQNKLAAAVSAFRGLVFSFILKSLQLAGRAATRPQRGWPAHTMPCGCAARVSTASCAHSSCPGEQHCQCLPLVSAHAAALYLHSSRGWNSRASLRLLPDGCATAPADPRAELLPKHWQNQCFLQWVARLIKPAGWSEPGRASGLGLYIPACCTAMQAFILQLLKLFTWNQDKFYSLISLWSFSELICLKFIQIWDDTYIISNCSTASKPQTNIVRTEMKYLTSWSLVCQNCITVCRNNTRAGFWMINKTKQIIKKKKKCRVVNKKSVKINL